MWSLHLTANFEKSFTRLDHSIQVRVKNYLNEVCSLKNPLQRAKALTGSLAGYHRLRVNDFRTLIRVDKDELVVIAIDVGHRSRIYRT